MSLESSCTKERAKIVPKKPETVEEFADILGDSPYEINHYFQKKVTLPSSSNIPALVFGHPELIAARE